MTAHVPTIVSRAQWLANPVSTPAGTIPVPSKELWLHHSAGEQFGPAGMRMLQAFTLHRQDAHYVDLEYTFVVDHQSCEIFESRGPGRNTAATGGHNDVSHAVCVMGNFQTDPVSPALVETLANLVAYGYEQGWWPLGFTGGHRDASGNSTACPGDHLEAVIPQINARAAAIHAGPKPAPPTVKVRPMFDPPLVMEPWAAAWKDDGGRVIAAVSKDGDVYAFGCAFRPWVNKNVDFAGKQAAQIGQAKGQAVGRYTITSTDGHTYTP